MSSRYLNKEGTAHGEIIVTLYNHEKEVKQASAIVGNYRLIYRVGIFLKEKIMPKRIVWVFDSLPVQEERERIAKSLQDNDCSFYLPGVPLHSGIYNAAVEHHATHVIFPEAMAPYVSFLAHMIQNGEMHSPPILCVYRGKGRFASLDSKAPSQLQTT